MSLGTDTVLDSAVIITPTPSQGKKQTSKQSVPIVTCPTQSYEASQSSKKGMIQAIEVGAEVDRGLMEEVTL